MAPVVSAALGALGPLLLKLTALLAGEFGRLKGVRREIRWLRSELTSMHAAVHKYTMLEDPDVQVKAWISLVRELAYDIEDCIDKFIHRLGTGGSHGGFKGFFRELARSLKTLGSRRGIAIQIDDLKSRVKQVKELKSSYKLDDIACTTSGHGALDPRLSTLFAEEANLVGVDNPRDVLAKWMMEDVGSTSDHLKVLSIVGFGGLGKTTLAQEICRKIQGHYHCQASISVSQKPDIKKIIKDMVSKVTCPDGFIKDMDIWDEATSIVKMRELLQHKRYLIIVDDIWSTSAWNAIKSIFPENNCSSRIITTTRISDVARSCCSGCDDRIYNMEPLSHSHSRRLFLKRIFGSTDYCPDMLKEVSDEILKKCGGLPLAIISISGLLGNKPFDKQEWEKVKRSIGSGLGRNQCLEGMNSILSLSYNDLPSNLKTCLLYLSVFPEDCVIDRERLVRRWVAEGFITEERGLSLEEVAENNFYELINRNMVKPVDIGYDGKARACRIHDMMLELLISKSTEDNFINVINGGQTVWENSHGYIRRLSIQHIDQELASVLANKDLRHVRSLTFMTTGCIKHLPSLVKFEALRVMDFEDSAGLEEYDLNGMEKLFQVKYMSFRNTGILSLPSGIVMLHDLETLDLRNTYIQELPSGIVQLTKLQHLLTARRFGGGRTKIPDGIGNMRNLRVISGFNITMSSVGAVEELGNLTCLLHLCVELNGGGSDQYKRHEQMLLSSLCKLGACKLQSLGIFSNDSTPLEFLDSWSPVPLSLQRFQISTDYHLMNTPKWIAPTLNSLAHLCISLVEVTEKDLHVLGKLEALISLELLSKSGQKERIAIQGYPTLKEISIVCTVEEGGTYITFVQAAMPKLEKLKLPFSVSVANNYGFYLGIEHLPCLKEAKLSLYNDGAGYFEVKDATAVIRNEAGVHPNHPEVIIVGEYSGERRSWQHR